MLRPWTSLVALGVLAAACGAQDEPLLVTVAPHVVFPQGLLDQTTKISLVVYDASADLACDAASGTVTGATDATPKVAQVDVTDCKSGGAKFCTQLDISRAKTPRLFGATATSASGAILAKGCVEQTIDLERIDLTITMVQFIPAAVCGNNILEATETCEPPGNADDPVCDGECHTKEIWVSVNSKKSGSTKAGGVGDKVRPMFAWPAQAGAAGRFVAVWGDKSPGNSQVAMRLLNDGLAPMAAGELGDEAASASFYVPNLPGSPPPYNVEPNSQFNPAVAVANGRYWVAFQDDDPLPGAPGGAQLDIHLRSIVAASLDAEQPQGTKVGINGPGGVGEAGVQSAPVLTAGPGGKLLVAWQSGPLGQPGQIFARTVDATTKALGAQVELSTGSTNQHVSCAGTTSGWLCVWEGGSGIKLRALGADGQPTSTETNVNDGSHQGLQAQPAIAVSDADRFAVVWSDQGAAGGADIFVQRFNADRSPIAQDQAQRVNDVVTAGAQSQPAIAGTGAAGGLYALAWVDGDSGAVRARLLGATGAYRANHVDGRTSEFPASLSKSSRANPVLAIGGVRPFLVVGWEDLGDSPLTRQPGIYARRFPLPQ